MPVAPTHALQKYLDRAYREALVAHHLGAQPAGDGDARLHVPIAMFAHVHPGGTHFYAGVHDDEMHFSASLVKVAAMYAAFALRAEAKALAPGFTARGPFLTALKGQFSATAAVPRIRNAGIGLKPDYEKVLEVTEHGSDSVTVDFGTNFAAHLREMIVPSNNSSAAKCIRRLGYAYINVALMRGTFFDDATINGIWLAADFAGGARVEIPTLNDGNAAQVVSAKAVARLFSAIRLDAAIDAAASADMRALLAEAQTTDRAWISRFGERRYRIEGVKVGVANLKPNEPPNKGPDVFSEGVLLRWKGDAAKLARFGLTGDLAACWQNLRRSAFGTGVPAIAGMIEQAFSGFLDQTPV